MTRQTDSTTNITQSSNNWFGKSLIVTGQVKYVGDRYLTRKEKYTKFLTERCFYAGYQCGYINLPRKLKKRWKRWAERSFYYDKERGVCFFNPKLLLTPVPQSILNMFKGALPVNSGQTMRFQRYNQIERKEE